MPREYWDCWEDDSTTPPTTSEPPSSIPPSSGPEPEPEFECYPPNIDAFIIQPTLFIDMIITKG